MPRARFRDGAQAGAPGFNDEAKMYIKGEGVLGSGTLSLTKKHGSDVDDDDDDDDDDWWLMIDVFWTFICMWNSLQQASIQTG